MGYLPEAMRNYLARLGWGHGDDELFTDAQAIDWFDVVDVGSSPARLDWAKLNHINQHYIRLAPTERLLPLVGSIFQMRGVNIDARALQRIRQTIPLVKEGAQTLLELADLTLFALNARPLTFTEKAQKLLTEETLERLGRLKPVLEAHADWTPAPLDAALHNFVKDEGIGLGKIGPAIRVLSGGAPAPDLGSALAALGRDESLGRFEDALSRSK
jgi:glutamyl-tRNA synthetase